MNQALYHLKLAFVTALVSSAIVCFAASRVEAYTAPWVDHLVEAVVVENELSKNRILDPYLKQLGQVREAAIRGDFVGVRKTLGQFLEMLEAKQGGISSDVADRIFVATFKTVPYRALLPLRNEDKLDPVEKKAVERVKRLANKIAEADARAALSF